MEYVCSLESKLFSIYLCFIRTRSRKWDIFEKLQQLSFSQSVTIFFYSNEWSGQAKTRARLTTGQRVTPKSGHPSRKDNFKANKLSIGFFANFIRNGNTNTEYWLGLSGSDSNWSIIEIIEKVWIVETKLTFTMVSRTTRSGSLA